MAKSVGEKKFAKYWGEAAPDLQLERELRFHPERRWRFDFAYLPLKLAVEIQGGVWMRKSAHNSGAGVARDCEKALEAVLLGWRVIPLTTGQVTKDTVRRIVEFARNAGQEN